METPEKRTGFFHETRPVPSSALFSLTALLLNPCRGECLSLRFETFTGHWNLLSRRELGTNREAWSQGQASPAAQVNQCYREGSLQLFDLQNWVLNMGLAHVGARTELRQLKVLLDVTCSQVMKLLPLQHGFELLTKLH